MSELAQSSIFIHYLLIAIYDLAIHWKSTFQIIKCSNYNPYLNCFSYKIALNCLRSADCLKSTNMSLQNMKHCCHHHNTGPLPELYEDWLGGCIMSIETPFYIFQNKCHHKVNSNICSIFWADSTGSIILGQA